MQQGKTNLVLFAGIIIISWSSIFIRWLGELPPLTIAFYRLAFSALLLLPFSKKSAVSIKPLKNKSYPALILLAGVFLAVHFYTWIYSLQLTTVGSSIFLESTHPIFGWLLSYLFLKERGARRLIIALILGLAGMYLLAAADMASGRDALLGDALAVAAAVCLAAYLLIARIMTGRMALLPYLVRVYGTAALLILPLLVFSGINFINLTTMDWFLLIVIALGPNLAGHSILNWASRRMPVYKVNMAMLGEAVLATFYAAVLLNEVPSANFYGGALLILLAIALIFWRSKNISISEV